jgi:NSS family neurotransmitter:Na+ symporter
MAEGSPGSTASAMQERFDALLGSPARIAAYHAVFMGLVAFIVTRGIAGGIEQACKVLMPILLVLIAALAVYSASEGDLAAALRFLFAFNLHAVTPRVALEALGLGFFSIGVGTAVMITYAAHADQSIDLRQAAVITIVSDTAVSFVAGLAVFPMVFAEGLDPSSGPGLLFVTVPLAFARLPFGTAATIVFFVLLAVAAIASALSLLEMPVAYLRRRFAWSRPIAVLISASVCWTLGLASVLSFNVWSGWYPLATVPALANATMFELVDDLASNVLLPAGGFALAIFGGWVAPTTLLAGELGLGPTATTILGILLRYVTPFGIAAAALAPLAF